MRSAKDSHMTLDLHKVAHALGGEVSGGQVRAPGPGHSAGDLSLSVTLDDKAPDGFLCHSFAGDDDIACKDYVRARLSLPKWEPNGGTGRASKRRTAGERRTRTAAPTAAKRTIAATFD
jgi:hypothetical protein